MTRLGFAVTTSADASALKRQRAEGDGVRYCLRGVQYSVEAVVCWNERDVNPWRDTSIVN